MSNYFYSKLFDINYKMQIDEGNATQRLASKSPEILFKLQEQYVPSKYLNDFQKLIKDIEKTVKLSEGRLPARIEGIYNKTAAKHIKLLIDIQYFLEEDRKD